MHEMRDTDPARIERLQKIGAYIVNNIPDLIRKWEVWSELIQPHATHEQRVELRNSLPEFLKSFGENLHRNIRQIPYHYAIEHGAQRWSRGWNIEELVRDFMILRRVLIERLRNALEIGVQDTMEIATTLDEAVALSVREYAHQQTHDLTDRNEKLERSNYELKRFATVLAHEIRNPLATITMSIDSICREMPENATAIEFLQLAREGVREVEAVVKEMLNYARAGDLGEEPVKVDLNLAFEDALLRLQNLIRECNADISAGELPFVLGHQQRLAQVLQNLIENAIKYRCPERAPKIHIAAAQHDGKWTITMEDNGLGIPQEHHKSIFRFLTRAHQDLDIAGSGIGLSLCRRMIEDMGGEIWVDSQVGEGSRFHFTIPRLEE